MQMAALYESITRSIIGDLEKGVPVWVQPWRTKRRTALGLLPANLATGRTYSGINIPILWHAAKSAGYPDPAWMTYRQALALVAKVRKGEKGTHIVFTRKTHRQEGGGRRTADQHAAELYCLQCRADRRAAADHRDAGGRTAAARRQRTAFH
ncbi:MAG: ArdC family protein [Rhodoplanes sp.]